MSKTLLSMFSSRNFMGFTIKLTNLYLNNDNIFMIYFNEYFLNIVLLLLSEYMSVNKILYLTPYCANYTLAPVPPKKSKSNLCYCGYKAVYKF